VERYEAAVLGGGPAGCAAAIALVRAGVGRVAVVAPRPRGPAIGETLLPDSGALLERLGVWERFVGEGHEPCLGSCSSWGEDAVGYNDFLLNVRGHGWHLDRARFDALLLDEAEAAGATVLRDARCTGLDGVGLRIAGGGSALTLRADAVVDATGSRAAYARLRGASGTWRDRLLFVYGFFDAGDAATALRMTMIEATESGWWYAAGLPGDRVAVAFASDPDLIREAGMARPDRWLSRLLRTRHVAPRLDGCRLRPGLVARVAPSGLSEPVAGDGWVAVGDAAASYDPLSGQGIHKALATGIEGAEALAAALHGDPSQIDAYAEAVADRFNAYRAERDGFYADEKRWAEAPFWHRRRLPVAR
jgi:flavin-dependent dehydrogenase